MNKIDRPERPKIGEPKKKSVRLCLTLQPYQKEFIAYFARKRGFRSMNEFILSLIDKEIERDDGENKK